MKKMRTIVIGLIYLFAIYGETLSKKKACVIGAGAAGLAMIKELSVYPEDFEAIAFERNSDVGGLWMYSENSDFDQHGLPIQSASYKNLVTNLPKFLMAFPDYTKFGDNSGTCSANHVVLEYLRNYTEHFNLRQFIKFDTLVKRVTPILGNDDWETTKWRVQTQDLITNRDYTMICDVIEICNGHFSKVNIPKIPGIESFHGRILHSHSYRRPEDFTDQTVVVLGAGTSGRDLAMDLSAYAKKIYLSHRHKKINADWPENVQEVRGVVSAIGNTLTLQDHSTINVDSFIYATGYKYDIPFLDESSDITVKAKKIYPLYKNFINAHHPSMGVVGLPFGMAQYYTMFYAQAKYHVAVLQGKIKLPNLEERLKDAKLSSGSFTPERWLAYYKELAEESESKILYTDYDDALTAWVNTMNNDWAYFKQAEFKMVNGKYEASYPWGRGPNYHKP